MAPELPGDPGEDDLPTPQILAPPLGSDDSDNEDDAYRGYQPLSMMDETEAPGDDSRDVDIYEQMDDDDEEQQQQQQQHNVENFNMEINHNELQEQFEEHQQNGNVVEEQDVEVTHGDPNLPHVESVDAEIERQVWCEPRPQELQIELDNTKTEQILNAMASFTLPNIAVPEWAAGVPEERWKEELLQRIRQRSDTATGQRQSGENNKK